MAYNQRGEYYFDALDETDQELLRARMNEHEINRNLDNLINQGNAQQLMNQIGQRCVEKVAKTHGMTPQQVVAAAGEDREFSEQKYEEGVTRYYDEIVTRPRDAQGRYVKAQPGQPQPQQAQAGQPIPQSPPAPALQTQPQRPQADGFFPQPTPRATPDRVQALKEAAATNDGTDVSLDRMLGALLPGDDQFLDPDIQ